jgi:hypothetical protein
MMSQDTRDDYGKQYTTTAHRGDVHITLGDEAKQFRNLPHDLRSHRNPAGSQVYRLNSIRADSSAKKNGCQWQPFFDQF